MIRDLKAAKARCGLKKNEVVAHRDWEGVLIRSDVSEDRLDFLRQLPDDIVLVEQDKFNAFAAACSLGDLRRGAFTQTKTGEDQKNPGYRFVTWSDLVSLSPEANLVNGILAGDPDIGTNEIIILCMRDARFNHTPEEWVQIIRDWREEYSRVTASIDASLKKMTTA